VPHGRVRKRPAAHTAAVPVSYRIPTEAPQAESMIAVRNASREHFATWGVAEIETEIVRSVDARREQRRFKHAFGEQAARLDPDALGSLARVLARGGFRCVRDLGDAAAVAWARRVGIEADRE